MFRRYFAAFLAVLSASSVLTAGVFAVPRLRGDANGDGKLNSRDVIDVAFGIAAPSDEWPELADYNADGTLNARDVVGLMRYLVGCYEANDDLLELTYGVSEPVFDVPDPVTEKTVTGDTFGFDPDAADNSEAFGAAAAYLAANPGTTLKLEKAAYRMGARQIDLSGIENCVIDGGGSSLLYGERNYFSVVGCDGLKLENLTIDWDVNSYHIASLVRIKSVRNTGLTEFEFFEEEDASYALDNEWGVLFNLDPEDLAPGVPAKSDWAGTEPYIKDRTLTAPNIISAWAPSLPLAVGEVYLIRHYQYGPTAFWVEGGSSNVVFENVTIRSGPACGFIMQNKVHHIRLTNVTIEPSPDLFRRCPISTTADAVNIRDTLGHIIIEGCSIGYCYDDFININDNVGSVEYVDGNVMDVSSSNWTAFQAGDTICVRDPKDRTRRDFSAKISAVSVSGNDFTLTLDKDCEGAVGEGDIIHNESTDSGNVIIRDCFFHQGRSRVLLGVSDSIIENCRFYKTQLIPLRFSIEMFPGMWCGGTGFRNVIVRNNVFESCNVRNDKDGAVIGFEALYDANRSGKILGECFTDVLIAHNRFVDPAGCIVQSVDTKNLTVYANTVELTREPWENVTRRLAGRIKIQSSYFEGTRILGNRWLPSPYWSDGVYVPTVSSSKWEIEIGGNQIK